MAIIVSFRYTCVVMKRLSRNVRSLRLIDRIRTTHLLLLSPRLPFVLPGPLCRPAWSSSFLFLFRPLLIPTSGSFLMLPSRMSRLISSRVIADETRSVSSGSTQTLVFPTLSKSAAKRFWLTRLISYSFFPWWSSVLISSSALPRWVLFLSPQLSRLLFLGRVRQRLALALSRALQAPSSGLG